MDYILHKLKSEFKLSEDSIKALVSIFNEKKLPKKHVLIKPESVCSEYFFIEKGLVRYFILSDGSEVTNWFSKEGDIAFSMMGAFYNKRGLEYADLLEDSVFYSAPVSKLNKLLSTNLELCNWSRKLHQKGFLSLEQRHLRLLTMSATERYQLFFNENPQLHNRINLGHLASFLGMSQVTLSRIRGNDSFLT